METLACVKRVPDTGASIPLTDDERGIDTSTLGFTVSPHEECAVEEAVQQVEAHGGATTVLTLGPEVATEQLQTAVAREADEAVLLETDGSEWHPAATAKAIAAAVRAKSEDGADFDLLLFGNEAADTEDHQVAVRVAHELDLPYVTAIKELDVENGTAVARREVSGGSEVYELDLPAVVAVKEGINSPRYPSMRSRMQAKKQPIERIEPERSDGDGGGLEAIRLEAPAAGGGEAEILGEGPAAAPRVVDVLDDMGVL
jgi:electron transfer flavoprotein beta subunit